jgi:hypothetical protein
VYTYRSSRFSCVQTQPQWSIRPSKEEEWITLVKKAYQNKSKKRPRYLKNLGVDACGESTDLQKCWSPLVIRNLARDAIEDTEHVLALLQLHAQSVSPGVAIALHLGAKLLPGGLSVARKLCKQHCAHHFSTVCLRIPQRCSGDLS